MTVTAGEGFLVGVGALVADAMLAALEGPGAVLTLVLSARAAPTRNGSDCDCDGQAIVSG